MSLPLPAAPVDAPAHADPATTDAVDHILLEHVDSHASELVAVDPRLVEVLDQVRGGLHGGKRIRASFCVWGARAAQPETSSPTPSPIPGVLEAAAALEMFHLGALVHDDVMDHSDLRRGAPTVRRRFADHHEAAGRHGDAAAFGDGVAVLVGDLCLMWADELLTAALARSWSSGPAVAPAVRTVWNQMRTQLVGGQYLDLLGQADMTTSHGIIERVLRYKSAGYTVEHPLLLGGTLAGAPHDLLASFRRFARPLGEALQLRDDLLGVFGESASTGKPTADDVREGKRTLLVAHADARADAAQRSVLRRHLGDPALDDGALDEVREVFVDTGAVDLVERRIEEKSGLARQVLASMSVDAATRDALAALVEACVRRDG